MVASYPPSTMDTVAPHFPPSVASHPPSTMAAQRIRRRECYDCICMFIITCILFIGVPLLILICSLADLTPSPTFTLHDFKLSTFNLSTTPTLTTNLLLTISARNENYNQAFHFEKLDVYASYMDQLQITPPTMLPPMYLQSPGVMVWSLSLNGTEVQVTPGLAAYLVQDVTDEDTSLTGPNHCYKQIGPGLAPRNEPDTTMVRRN
ncbi:hypothetical protein HanRHA438_Chr03g0145501 [Helianthus annuus]|nr:putative protein NDR1 [Helianthus annuus]KAJ0937752.1 hypothetical protein HanRHA438_Chr03g0145501 [Helianthus annuus]KAJ0945709.1 hypothetical protein HanPSC8_Chr03g0131181 [Helianthus annuus]